MHIDAYTYTVAFVQSGKFENQYSKRLCRERQIELFVNSALQLFRKLNFFSAFSAVTRTHSITIK